mgnify:CR=1 FL=1
MWNKERVAEIVNGNKLVVFATGNPEQELNGWLFANSQLYRLAVRLFMCSGLQDWNEDAVADEVAASLAELKRFLAERDVRLSVILFPSLEDQDNWWDLEKNSRVTVIRQL